MKNVLISSVIALCAVLVGCDKLPSEEKISNLSKTIGYAAGLSCDLAKMDDATRRVTLEVMDIVDDVVPQTNESFTVAWKPLIESTVNKFVTDGKIDEKQAAIVKTVMNAVTMGIDYMFDVRWPEAKNYKNLVSAAVHGFTEGFKTVIRPPDMLTAAKFDYDEKEFTMAMNYFKNKRDK